MGSEPLDQHPATVEETRAYFESLYNNLAIEVVKVNSVNRKMKEINADLTTELARYKNKEKCFEISQEKYDKLEMCYQKWLSRTIQICSTETLNLNAKGTDDLLAKHKTLELEIRAVCLEQLINPFKPSREETYVPTKVRASVRTNPITVSQPHVVTKKDVNSDSNGLSSTGVSQNTEQTKNDKGPSRLRLEFVNKNKEVEVEEHPRNLLLSKNKKHMSSECNNVKLAIRNDKSEVICAMCKQCLITANHDVCMLNYVNDMNSRGKKQKAHVSNTENQKKQKPKDIKPKKVGSNGRLLHPKPIKPRFGH
ncbi:hypothetical protein Tco_0787976 [Tanacetum coccineum]